MSITDRLDEIESVAAYLDDDDMEAEVLAATAALRRVQNLLDNLDEQLKQDGAPNREAVINDLGGWSNQEVGELLAALSIRDQLRKALEES